MKKTILSIVVASSIALQGCSLPMSFVDDSLYVSCSASSPTITINGQSFNTSSIEHDLPRGKAAYVTCSDEGYQTQSAKVDTGMSGAGLFDSIAGWFAIFPFFGLLLPGSEALEEDELHMVLPKDYAPVYYQSVPQQTNQQPVTININNN